MGVGKLSDVNVGDIDNVSSVSDIANISGIEYSQNATVFTIDTSLGDGNADMLLRFTSSGPGAEEIVVNWGDGTEDTYTTTGDKSHTYSTGGVYTVSFFCSVNVYLSNNFGTPAEREGGPFKITNVTRWGTSAIWNMRDSRNLTNVTALDEPNIFQSAVQVGFFNDCRGLINVNGLESWDVNGFNLGDWFANCLLWNQDISGWDVSNVTNMRQMFFFATAFNQDISGWDVNSVTNMGYMFFSATAFNQDLSSWNVSSVTDMTDMFRSATDFNQDISGWNVSSVTQMFGMFRSATAFDQPLNSWDVSGVQNMAGMFRSATAFNQPLNSWNVSSVRNTDFMFFGATAFDQPLNSWNVSSVQNMTDMFSGASAFDQDLGAWTLKDSCIMNQIFNNSGMSDANVALCLEGWDSVGQGTSVDATDMFGTTARTLSESTYPDAKSAYDNLISTYSWDFTGSFNWVA
jgi:surface protein